MRAAIILSACLMALTLNACAQLESHMEVGDYASDDYGDHTGPVEGLTPMTPGTLPATEHASQGARP